MNPKNDFIEELIDRFFEGSSSAEEENTLYSFFMRENVPEHFLKYKPVFLYFATGIVDEFNVADAMQKQLNLRRRKQRVVWWAAAAAMVLLILSATVLKTLQTPEFDPYEGSYVIRKGVRIVDPKLIRPELEKTVELAMAQQNEYRRLIQQTKESENAYIQAMKKVVEHKKEIANRFVDENVKRTVIKILKI
jgi:hypothetical protein